MPEQWTIRLDGSELPDKQLIGGKAWSLARMRSLGLPVPPAFVVTTRACKAYQDQQDFPDGLIDEIREGVHWLEAQSGRCFGSGPEALLLSIRSGAPISMPGMMDTVLNLGINADTASALAEETGDNRFATDTYRRFLEMYAKIVLKATPPELDPDAGPDAWLEAVNAAAPSPVPDTLEERLMAAIRAVFDSWGNRRARRYRKHNNIPDDLGTAVVVQAMVFGNLDDNSGTGVLFSRNPLNGEREPYGEYLARAQGEDVVSGEHTPDKLEAMQSRQPEAHAKLLEAARVLEDENGDVQDIEFTVQKGELFLLQSRTAKRAPAAAVRIAVDMQRDGIISADQALARVTSTQARALLAPRLAEGAAAAASVLASGQGACPGVGTGRIVTDSDEAETRAEGGEAVVLARRSTSPEDVHGMLAARAIATETGGSTSHAAVVSRALGRPCVVGCGEASLLAHAGETVTVDGDAGKVYAGALEVVVPDERDDPALVELLAWAVDRAPIRVIRPDEAQGLDALDLDSIDGGEDPERLPELLAGASAARGGAIASDAGVAAALNAGVSAIVAEPTLPVMLAALHQSRARNG